VNERQVGYALVAGAAASWGTWSLFLRPAARVGPLAPELVALVVQGTMALVTLPWCCRGAPAGRRPTWAWALMVALGVSDALNGWLFFKAMSLTTLAVAVLTHSLAPLLVAAVAPWAAREPARTRTWVCLAGALGGLTLLLRPWASPAQGVVAGASAGAASALFYAFNILVQKRLGGHFSGPEVVGYHAVVSAGVLALLVPAGGFALAPSQALLVGVAALLLGAAGALAFLAGLRRIPASHAATLALLEPLVAVLVGVLIWGEPLGLLGALGGLLVLGSLLVSVLP
jgi:drug/metabolite transporter (DMT)-like permease